MEVTHIAARVKFGKFPLTAKCHGDLLIQYNKISGNCGLQESRSGCPGLNFISTTRGKGSLGARAPVPTVGTLTSRKVALPNQLASFIPISAPYTATYMPKSDIWPIRYWVSSHYGGFSLAYNNYRRPGWLCDRKNHHRSRDLRMGFWCILVASLFRNCNPQFRIDFREQSTTRSDRVALY